MPIRFRCRFCNQLMGISRRKAGMTVECPTCHGQVVVPHADTAEPPAAAKNKPAAPAPEAAAATAPPLFERSDFEAFLLGPANEAPPPRESNPPPPGLPAPAEFERLPSPSLPSSVPPRSQAGLVLSPTQATWLTVLAILLLALAFGAGLLVGHYWMD